MFCGLQEQQLVCMSNNCNTQSEPDQVKLVRFLTELPTLNLACCPKARKETNTDCRPRTRTPMFLLSDIKIGLRNVRV